MEISQDVHALLNCLENPAILLGKDYQILAANHAYQAVYGDEKSLTNRRCYEVSHGNTVPCDQAGEHCPLQACLETGQTSRVLHIHHTPRGQEYVNVETWPVKDDHGEIIYFVEVLHPSDIARPDTGKGLIGSSPVFQCMLGYVQRVAPSDTNVLLLGESGTGKELIARAIHDRSDRSTGPFVPVECTGLPNTLFESELFGYVKGAFTGASSNKPGLVEAADGGTLFLDEVGDIPLSDQVKLLRLLETRQYRRVGSTEPRSADFRLVCATNKDLAAMVERGEYREDLYYRLNVFEINLPPLRDRGDDIAALANSMLARVNPGLALSDEALACLETYNFPGNIRELRNIVERAALMCDGSVILPVHLPEKFTGAPAPTGPEPLSSRLQTLEELEKEYLKNALRNHTGSRRELADDLGISERALYRKLSRLRSDGA